MKATVLCLSRPNMNCIFLFVHEVETAKKLAKSLQEHLPEYTINQGQYFQEKKTIFIKTQDISQAMQKLQTFFSPRLDSYCFVISKDSQRRMESFGTIVADELETFPPNNLNDLEKE